MEINSKVGKSNTYQIEGYDTSTSYYNGFKTLEEEINKTFEGNEGYNIRFTYSKDIKELLINIRLNKETKENSFKRHISFLIILNDKYPHSEPILLCKTNFTFPTLFDNSNLIRSLIDKWSSQNATYKLIEIIQHLPAYIAKKDRDFNHGLLYYDGYYNLTSYYNINDFLLNPDITLFKIQMLYQEKTSTRMSFHSINCYIIITDIYLMILFPETKLKKNKAKIIYQEQIRMLDSIVSQKPIKAKDNEMIMHLQFNWKANYHPKFKQIISIEKDQFIILESLIYNKRDKLNQLFTITFPNNHSSIEDIQKIIDLREEEIINENNFYAHLDLLELYQKIIELYEAIKSDKVALYIEKLNKLAKVNHD